MINEDKYTIEVEELYRKVHQGTKYTLVYKENDVEKRVYSYNFGTLKKFVNNGFVREYSDWGTGNKKFLSGIHNA